MNIGCHIINNKELHVNKVLNVSLCFLIENLLLSDANWGSTIPPAAIVGNKYCTVLLLLTTVNFSPQ